MDELRECKIIGRATKIRIFNSDVKAIIVCIRVLDIYTENNKKATIFHQLSILRIVIYTGQTKSAVSL